jgi:hypothetical protein
MIEELKFNLINIGALTAGMFLTNVETTLSILVLISALIYNIIKIYKNNKPNK